MLRIGRTCSWRMVGIPLIDDGRVLGTLVACKHQEGISTETQLRWLLIMASMLTAGMQFRWLKSVVEMLTSAPRTSALSVSDIRWEAIAPGEEDLLFEHAYGHLVG